MKKLLVLSLLTASAFAYTNCANCHNGGYKQKLDMYTPAQIVTILNEYKQGKRGGMMSSFVAAMSEADIKAAAKEFGKK
jgi:cytochrome c553